MGPPEWRCISIQSAKAGHRHGHKLTERQQEILDLIRQTVARTGFPPTRAEIAQALGFRSPNAAEDHLKALAQGRDRTDRWRLPRHPSQGAGQRNALGPTTHPLLAQLVLPLVGRVAAGSPILASEHVEREVGVDPGLFAQTPDYLLKVRGMSMRDAGILEGDLLAVKARRRGRNGQIVVARLGDEVTVKRLQRQNGRIELLPEPRLCSHRRGQHRRIRARRHRGRPDPHPALH